MTIYEFVMNIREALYFAVHSKAVFAGLFVAFTLIVLRSVGGFLWQWGKEHMNE